MTIEISEEQDREAKESCIALIRSEIESAKARIAGLQASLAAERARVPRAHTIVRGVIDQFIHEDAERILRNCATGRLTPLTESPGFQYQTLKPEHA